MTCAHAGATAAPEVAPAAIDLTEAEEEVSPLLTGVSFYALETQQDGLMWDVNPSHVILYHPDIPFIRQLEVSLLARPCVSSPGHGCHSAEDGLLYIVNTSHMVLYHPDIPPSASWPR